MSAWDNPDPHTNLRCPLDGDRMVYLSTRPPTGLAGPSGPQDVYVCDGCASTFTVASFAPLGTVATPAFYEIRLPRKEPFGGDDDSE